MSTIRRAGGSTCTGYGRWGVSPGICYTHVHEIFEMKRPAVDYKG